MAQDTQSDWFQTVQEFQSNSQELTQEPSQEPVQKLKREYTQLERSGDGTSMCSGDLILWYLGIWVAVFHEEDLFFYGATTLYYVGDIKGTQNSIDTPYHQSYYTSYDNAKCNSNDVKTHIRQKPKSSKENPTNVEK